MIKISHLQKKYPNVTPLKDVNVEIHTGDVISIIGPSGTGKSTLIRLTISPEYEGRNIFIACGRTMRKNV